MNYKKLLILFLFLALYGCKETKNSRDIEIKNIVNTNVAKINLSNQAKISRIEKLSDIFKTPEILTLEQINNNEFIGSINKINIKNNNLYILDKSFSKTLWVYSIKGEFKFKLATSGTGPKEFSYISDFSVNNQYIIISDQYLKKLIIFDQNGKFITEKKFPYFFYEFIITEDNHIILVTGTTNESTSKENALETNLINKNIIALRLEDLSITDTFHEYKDFRDNFKKIKGIDANQNKNLISPFYDNTIYTFENNFKISPYYFIDFGDKNLNYNDLTNLSSIEKIENFLTKNNDKKYFIDNLSFNEDWLYFTYKTNARKEKNHIRYDYIHVFYNFKDDKIYEINNFYKRNDLIDLTLFKILCITNDNKIVTVVSSEEYKKISPKEKETNNLNPVIILLPLK